MKYRKKELTNIEELKDDFKYGQMIHVHSVTSMCHGLLYPEYDCRIIDRIDARESIYSKWKNGSSLLPFDYAYLVQKKYKNNRWSKPFPLCLQKGDGNGTLIL